MKSILDYEREDALREIRELNETFELDAREEAQALAIIEVAKWERSPEGRDYLRWKKLKDKNPEGGRNG